MMQKRTHLEDILESVTKDQPGWTCDPCEVQQNNDPPSTNLVDLISIFNQRCGFPDVDDSKEPPGEEDSAAGSLDIFLAFNPSESELKISQMPDASDFGEPCDMAEILRELGVDQARHQPKPPDISGGLGRRQNKRDLVQLEHFVVQSMRLMVYQGQLCVYEALLEKAKRPCGRNKDTGRTGKERTWQLPDSSGLPQHPSESADKPGASSGR